MALKITRVDVWAGSIDDRPGGLAQRLRAVSKAGANLEFTIARRQPNLPGRGTAFLAPIKGAKVTAAARAEGFEKPANLYSLRIEAGDRKGLAADIAEAVGRAGINMRGLSAAGLGKKCVMYLGFDSSADADAAAKVVKKIKK
jgi:hypothetical protein